jgi:hypothetical protein
MNGGSDLLPFSPFLFHEQAGLFRRRMQTDLHRGVLAGLLFLAHDLLCLSLERRMVSLLTFPAVLENVDRVQRLGIFSTWGNSSLKR